MIITLKSSLICLGYTGTKDGYYIKQKVFLR